MAGTVTLACLARLRAQHGLPLRHLRRFLAEAKSCAGYPEWDVGCRITSDLAVQRLNKRYRGVDAPTDVLSFAVYALPAPERWPAGLEPDDKNLGDIFISAPYVSAWCARHGADPVERLELLLVHGLTHLLGYDHVADADHVAMQAREEGILAEARRSVGPHRADEARPRGSRAARPLTAAP